MIKSIFKLIFDLLKSLFKLHIQKYLVLIFVIGLISPFYKFLITDIDSNLKELIIVQENKELNEIEIISQCISKKVIVNTNLKKEISNKNINVNSNKNSLSKYTKNECNKFYITHKNNTNIQNNYYKQFLPYLMVFYFILRLITKRWI